MEFIHVMAKLIFNSYCSSIQYYMITQKSF